MNGSDIWAFSKMKTIYSYIAQKLKFRKKDTKNAFIYWEYNIMVTFTHLTNREFRRIMICGEFCHGLIWAKEREIYGAAAARGFLRTRITESPRRNILAINLSLFTGLPFFCPFPVFGISVHISLTWSNTNETWCKTLKQQPTFGNIIANYKYPCSSSYEQFPFFLK